LNANEQARETNNKMVCSQSRTGDKEQEREEEEDEEEEELNGACAVPGIACVAGTCSRVIALFVLLHVFTIHMIGMHSEEQ